MIIYCIISLPSEPTKVIWVNFVKDLLQITFLVVSQVGLFKVYTACQYMIHCVRLLAWYTDWCFFTFQKVLLYFDLRPSPKILFQGDTLEGSDTFQWPVIERDRVGGLRLMIWDKVKVSLCHYSHSPEESNF